MWLIGIRDIRGMQIAYVKAVKVSGLEPHKDLMGNK